MCGSLSSCLGAETWAIGRDLGDLPALGSHL